MLFLPGDSGVEVVLVCYYVIVLAVGRAYYVGPTCDSGGVCVGVIMLVVASTCDGGGGCVCVIMLVVGPTCDSGGGCVGVIMLVVGPTCESGGAYYVSRWSYL